MTDETAAKTRKVQVSLAGLESKSALADKNYDIHIGPGLLTRSGALISPLLRRPFTVVVGDEAVMDLYFPLLQTSLKDAGIEVHAIRVPSGEASKNFAHLQSVCDSLLAVKIERNDTIIALGGGVIGDLAGFCAAIILRGIGLIHCPTTLLAQVDSAIGGKTGINCAHGKNLIGAFHQPLLVLADMDVLATLPDREVRAGYAEIVKYALLGDSDFFIWLEENHPAILAGDMQTGDISACATKARLYAIEKSCLAKADIVARDEYESGLRSLLNLGHSFAHALEAWAGYDGRLLHGEAVSIGIVLAFHLSVRLGFCHEADLHRVKSHFRAVGLPISAKQRIPSLPDGAALFSLMQQDKKSYGGRIGFILVRGIGDAFICREVEAPVVIDFLNDSLKL